MEFSFSLLRSLDRLAAALFLARLFQYLSSFDASGTGSFLSRLELELDPLKVEPSHLQSNLLNGL